MAGFSLSLRVTAFLGAVLIASNAFAANRFRINDVEAAMGSEGVEIPILADLDQDTYAFSISLLYDQTMIEVTEVRLGSATEPLEPQFNAGQINNDDGELYHGIVFALEEDRINRRVNTGTNREILVLVVNVIAEDFGSSDLDLRNGSSPGARNVMTNEDGDSITPSLIDGDFTVPDTRPTIDSLADNEGEEGDQFTVDGENLDGNIVSVEVCGNDADWERVDGNTLRITAPACADLGWATLEICNDTGCVTENNGFNYTRVRAAPIVTGYPLGQDGRVGGAFLVEGRNFDRPDLAVSVCGVELTSPDGFRLLPGPGPTRAITITLPDCDPGWAVLEICNDVGCDTEEEGVNYQQTGGERLPGDCNQDGALDLSDGVCILGFLFLGDPVELPCGDDPTSAANLEVADFNESGVVGLEDGVATFTFLFQGGPPHHGGRVCKTIAGCSNGPCP